MYVFAVVVCFVQRTLTPVLTTIMLEQNRQTFQRMCVLLCAGVFVTMNPGYAGRSELPDNLKAIVRPVSMMVPDFTLIAEIMMFSEGFSTAKVLAKKMIAIMELSQQQLSKQDHYDYSLRSFVIPIARAAGALKRGDPDASEEVCVGCIRTQKSYSVTAASKRMYYLKYIRDGRPKMLSNVSRSGFVFKL